MNYRIFKRFLPKRALTFIRNMRNRTYLISHHLKKINTQYSLTEFGKKGCDTYFGYYDITPFNSKDDIVYLEVPCGGDTANIIFNDISNSKKRIISTTKAFNTQQGCRLRWFPNTDDKIMFNDFVDNHYICRIIDIEKNNEIVWNNPVYDISNDGSIYATLDFERLGNMRPGYGYTNRVYKAQKDLSNEGIFIYNALNNSLISSITYSDIACEMGKPDIILTNCYINHLSFSPDSKNLLFFWIEKHGNWHHANLLTYDIINRKIHVHERDYKVSHYSWFDNDTILCTAIKGNCINNMSCRYYLYQNNHNRRIIGEESLTVDGHPTYYNDYTILSDTYPNKYSMQSLFLYDVQEKRKQLLVYSYSEKVKSEEFRTDMHPRFNQQKNLICYDANVQGERKMYILKDWK